MEIVIMMTQKIKKKSSKKKKSTAADLNKMSLHLRKQLLSSHPHNWELFWLTFLFPPNYIVHQCSKIYKES